jgi:hypothetical protein
MTSCATSAGGFSLTLPEIFVSRNAATLATHCLAKGNWYQSLRNLRRCVENVQ